MGHIILSLTSERAKALIADLVTLNELEYSSVGELQNMDLIECLELEVFENNEVSTKLRERLLNT